MTPRRRSTPPATQSSHTSTLPLPPAPQIAGSPRQTMLAKFLAARRVSTPIIAITTPDPAATIQTICTALNGSTLAFEWDASQGLLGRTPEAAAYLPDLIGPDVDRRAATKDPAETLAIVRKLPSGTILFFHNAHRWLDPTKNGSEETIQAVWNLRDLFKGDRRTLILLGPDCELPAELRQDVRILDEPLPDDTQLHAIIAEQISAAQQQVSTVPSPDNTTMAAAIDALRGIAAFPAEQITAENLSHTGLHITGLWEAKRKLIEQSPGLTIWRGQEQFDSLKGLDNIKTFLSRVITGERPPRVIVVMDEFEKMMSGSRGGDLSGTSQKMHGTLLSFMEDTGATGLIAFGVSGAGKTAIAKALGGEANGLTILCNVAAMEGSLVGESVKNLRAALKVIQAVSGGRALFYAACNGLAAISPELLQRFSFGTFFFDLPTSDEKASIWSLYQDVYTLPEQPRPDDNGWVGRNIKQCCELAARLRCTLLEASSYIVPAGRAAAADIQRMREQAHGNFISASYPGVYLIDRATTTPTRPRALTITPPPPGNTPRNN